MKYNILFLAILLLLFSCNEPEARRPKQHSVTNFYKEVLEKNKKLNKRERLYLERLIQQDTLNNYKTSSSGFWYTYIKKDTTQNNILPKADDVVTIEYTISDIQGNELYEKQLVDYKVDKEDFIPALQDGIKLMKKGETIKFIIPSYRAYGVTGDGSKISINQPLKSTITLINIKQQKDEIK